ncbi:baeRF3 domain-containing protein [Dinghuibacter silviterrae]|uniref:ERF1-like protein n=1 Tax=Dinghuibacter silviterrae TaxID=1539049 RepID=A0A4V3GKR7_9BACT|nr:hypothetical protein [Dinghuibacter silviterrae]TDW96692.1 hypothetical protein EDB95_4528 [Dinghuibacter silviterrae]
MKTLSQPAPCLGIPERAPSVVVVLPFEPAMTPKSLLEASVKAALAQAEKQVLATHSGQTALPVLQQLRRLAGDLNYATHRKSLALFASADFGKALYLDMDTDTRVLVDSGFRMRDLAETRNTKVPYLVLLLSGRLSKMFHCDGTRWTLIKDNICHSLPHEALDNECPPVPKDQLLDKFLRQMDQGLSMMLDAWPLPVFVIGTDKVVGHFAALTRNNRQIAACIHKNGIGLTATELAGLLQPYLDNWQTVRQQMAMKHLELALEMGKLTTGIEAIRKNIGARNGRLLIVEKNYTGAGQGQGQVARLHGPFYIADPIDDIIEKVLACGGRVEWVEDGQLKDFGGVALVRYY